MAYYVNPPNETKEAFLERVGTRIEKVSTLREYRGERRLVVWKNNGPFTAAGVPADDRDLVEGFQTSGDWRETKYYSVPLSELQAAVTERDWARMNDVAEA